MAITALNAIQPKCRPLNIQALPTTPKPYIATMVATIQCRAGTDAIEGATTSNSPPQTQPTVPICQHSLMRFRSRGGSIVARANTLVSPSTPWIDGHHDGGQSGAL